MKIFYSFFKTIKSHKWNEYWTGKKWKLYQRILGWKETIFSMVDVLLYIRFKLHHVGTEWHHLRATFNMNEIPINISSTNDTSDFPYMIRARFSAQKCLSINMDVYVFIYLLVWKRDKITIKIAEGTSQEFFSPRVDTACIDIANIIEKPNYLHQLNCVDIYSCNKHEIFSSLQPFRTTCSQVRNQCIFYGDQNVE